MIVMSEQVKITVRLPKKLHQQAREKCQNEFGIGISHLLKIFLKAFVTQKGIGFYVGDDDLCRLISRWIVRREYECKNPRSGKYRAPGPRLKDIYEL